MVGAEQLSEVFMAQLTIGPRRVWIKTADGVLGRVYTAFIESVGYSGSLEDCTGIAETNLDIRYKGLFGSRRIPVTERIQDGILQFLREFSGKGDVSFDCYSFVNLVHDRPLHQKRYLVRDWSLYPLISLPPPGTPVFLLTCEHNRFHHGAIYIGLNLYISVYGAGGDLYISTLDDMVRMYKSKDVVFGVPLPHYI
jgi:cell wall-associated NlpC family hydrolase